MERIKNNRGQTTFLDQGGMLNAKEAKVDIITRTIGDRPRF